jgi:hypothetical protein
MENGELLKDITSPRRDMLIVIARLLKTPRNKTSFDKMVKLSQVMLKIKKTHFIGVVLHTLY